jgi:DNA-binding SARP family transcriptional activator
LRRNEGLVTSGGRGRSVGRTALSASTERDQWRQVGHGQGSVSTTAAPQTGRNPGPYSITLALLGGFHLTRNGTMVEVPDREQRLIALLLALDPVPLTRKRIAGALWPDCSDERSNANLRTLVWRIHPLGGLVEATRTQLRLAPWVKVDVEELSALSKQVLDSESTIPDALDLRLLSFDLLPEWDDEWVLPEREKFRQIRLHVLELHSGRLLVTGRIAQAVQAALAAVTGEPLRESARTALIKAYLAEGNISEALLQYHEYRVLLHRELQIDPSPELVRIIEQEIKAHARK